ncbi:NADH:ubiquinone oxidoreductase [Bacillus changyiensis]|uniref:NADH:ubiquinone oxidoreductase n=1 Tax=Bacillus changyiensis TaxID=3004103 RepID=UPI0022E20845|nr:NADH:ubiquinone oxidoreductase [Bacillus changyiensis]MDA1476169.1 NADH:ubiquinone oxidoreductase [Bacillus changyiensis]
MYKNFYIYPNVYSNIYQNPYCYPRQYSYYMYENRPMEDYYIRVPKFADLIGKYYTTSKPVTLPTGYTIPAKTRIFIHNVMITSTGQELVTIVAPVKKDGTIVNESIKDIPANQL